MKKSAHRHSRVAARASVRGWERRLQAALRSQPTDAIDLFSDRDEDVVEYAALLRGFEGVREEALEAERYS